MVFLPHSSRREIEAAAGRGAPGRTLPNYRRCLSHQRTAPPIPLPLFQAAPQETLVVSSDGQRSVGPVQAGGRPRACQCAARAGGHGPSVAGGGTGWRRAAEEVALIHTRLGPSGVLQRGKVALSAPLVSCRVPRERCKSDCRAGCSSRGTSGWNSNWIVLGTHMGRMM